MMKSQAMNLLMRCLVKEGEREFEFEFEDEYIFLSFLSIQIAGNDYKQQPTGKLIICIRDERDL